MMVIVAILTVWMLELNGDDTQSDRYVSGENSILTHWSAPSLSSPLPLLHALSLSPSFSSLFSSDFNNRIIYLEVYRRGYWGDQMGDPHARPPDISQWV